MGRGVLLSVLAGALVLEMTRRLIPWVVRLTGLVLFIALVLLVRRSYDEWFMLATWTTLVKANRVGAPLLFVPTYALASTLLIPTLPLNIAAGILWGPLVGSALALAGSVLGALAAFGISRGAIGDWLTPHANGRALSWMESELARHGWKAVAFVRLNPVFPGPVNFLFGLTGIRFTTYAWATAVFLTPPTLAFALIGSALGDLAAPAAVDGIRTPLMIGGALVVLLTIAGISRKSGRPAASDPDSISLSSGSSSGVPTTER